MLKGLNLRYFIIDKVTLTNSFVLTNKDDVINFLSRKDFTKFVCLVDYRGKNILPKFKNNSYNAIKNELSNVESILLRGINKKIREQK